MTRELIRVWIKTEIDLRKVLLSIILLSTVVTNGRNENLNLAFYCS